MNDALRVMRDNQTNPGDRVVFSRPCHLSGIELADASYQGRSFPVHSHDEYVVGVVVKGCERLSIGKKDYRVEAGMTLRLYPGQAHANSSVDGHTMHYRVFYIEEEAMKRIIGPHVHGRIIFPEPILTDPQIADALNRCHLSLSDGNSDRLTEEDALIAVLSEVTADCSYMEPPENGTNGKVIIRAKDHIDECFREDFGLDELADIAGLSSFRFAHRFKEEIGISPMAYRNQRRIHAAKEMLLKGETIAAVALDLGFADQSHFTRLFQRVIGISPGRYQQQ